MSAAALCALAFAVAAGAVLLGAPPRFSAAGAEPSALRDFLVALGPLATIEAGAALAFAVLVAAECLRRESPALPGGRAAARARLPLVLLLVLGLVQFVPLPAGVLGIVAPFSARTYASLTASGDDTLRPMTLWPAGTAHALFNLTGVIAASAATWALVRAAPRRAATAVLVFVAALAAVEAAHGLATTYLGDDLLLGTFAKISGRGRVTGTFVHGTMMAVWMGMGAFAAFGLAACAAFAGGKKRLVVGAIVVAAICMGAGLLALSRLGAIALVAGALVTGVLLAFAAVRSGRRGAAVAIGTLTASLVAGAVLVVFLLPAFRERVGYLLAEHGVEEPRFAMWGSTWDLFRESPVLGTGLGSFGRAIHLTQSPDCAQELWFAHSDPLNLLSDAGLVGAALGVWWTLTMLRRGLPALRSADVATRCLAAGAFGGAVVVLVASLGDFQTQFPVVAIAFAALFTVPAALADAASPASPPTESTVEPRPWLVPPRVLAGFVMLAGVTAAAVPVAQAVRRGNDLRESGATGATRAEALLAEGRVLLAGAPAAADPRAQVRDAETRLREASRLDPLLDEAHLWTAFAALYSSDPRDDVLRALGRARLVARGHAQTNLIAGKTYLDLLGTSPAPHGPPGDGAIAALREAGAIEPKAYAAAWKLAFEHGFSIEQLRAMTPDRRYARILLFDHLRDLGRVDEAIALLEDSLAREPWHHELTTRLVPAYRGTGRESEGRAFFAKVGAKWPE